MAASVQVIDGEGTFRRSELDEFMNTSGVMNAKNMYQIVAIMGPQSSGKSTLMNHVFGTRFQEMDAMSGRRQTTKGVWLATSPLVEDLRTMVMDLEGSDGRERGEDDTNFERQTALFALAVADTLLVNIWCHDIGREHGSGKPLMKTIFQVNLKLFAPDPNRRKTVLLFVIRDKSKTPLPMLVEVLETDLKRMWGTISKPPQYADNELTDFFEVQYAALSNFEEKYEEFQAEAEVLRERFSPSAQDTLVRQVEQLPADSMALSIQNIWEIIRTQKDLNLPAHKVMVANVRCKEILEDQLRNFKQDQAWVNLQEEAQQSLVSEFGKIVASLLDSCVQGYELEAMYFDVGVRSSVKSELVEKLHSLVLPTFKHQLEIVNEQLLGGFEKQVRRGPEDPSIGFSQWASDCKAKALRDFDQHLEGVMVPGTYWNGEEQKQALAGEIEKSIQQKVDAKVKEAYKQVDASMSKDMSFPCINLLETFPGNLWSRLHQVRLTASGAAEKLLFDKLKGYHLAEERQVQLINKLQASGDQKLRSHIQEAALTVLSRMKDRFAQVFSMDPNNTPRTWGVREDVAAVATEARLCAAQVLGMLSVFRPVDGAFPDHVQQAVLQLAHRDLGTNGEGGVSEGEDAPDILSISHWPEVPDGDVLLQPHEVRRYWREFMSASNVHVQQALATQQANRLAGKRNLPIWAFLAMAVLGWNEFKAVIWNPIYLLLGIAGVLFMRSLYNELDPDNELQQGFVPGIVRLGLRLGPAVRRVSQKTLDGAMGLLSDGGERLQQTLGSPGKKDGPSTSSGGDHVVSSSGVEMTSPHSRSRGQTTSNSTSAVSTQE